MEYIFRYLWNNQTHQKLIVIMMANNDVKAIFDLENVDFRNNQDQAIASLRNRFDGINITSGIREIYGQNNVDVHDFEEVMNYPQ